MGAGKARVLYGVSPQHPVVCVVGLGHPSPPKEPLERRDEGREVIRAATAGELSSAS